MPDKNTKEIYPLSLNLLCNICLTTIQRTQKLSLTLRKNQNKIKPDNTTEGKHRL